jgi:hypothetical protein
MGGGISSTSLEGLATSHLTMTNSTISGNLADYGGGIYNSGEASLNNVTITNNTSSVTGPGGGGGGVANTGNLKNSIIAGNWDNTGNSPDCIGTVVSDGYNLIQDTSGCTISGDTTGNIIGVSPNLGPLQGNGGSTFTHALLAGNPTIDAGNPAIPGSGGNACEAVDQRGISRLQSLNCDMGAYEFTPSEVSQKVYLPLVLK